MWSPLDYYFDIVNSKVEGLILGNLKIAEDRILSMASCLKTKTRAIQAVAPAAVFYFEAEGILKFFQLQRRRWINGTVAAYLFLIRYPSWIWNSKFTILSKGVITLLILGQLVIYSIVAIAPAIFLFSLRYIMMVTTPTFELECSDTDSGTSNCTVASGFTLLPNILWLLVFLLYGFFSFTHSREGEEYKYKHSLFILLLLVGAITVIGSAGGLVAYFAFLTHSFYVTLSLSIVLGIMFYPILISLLISPTSALLMITSFFQFYLFLPMLVAFFSTYSFARLWDVSWGTRDSEGEDIGDAKQTAKLINYLIIIINFLVVIVFSSFGVVSEQSQIFFFSIVLVIFTFTIVQSILSCYYFARYFILRMALIIFEIIDVIFHLRLLEEQDEEKTTLIAESVPEIPL